jgi:hypothetical protein
MDTNHRTIKLTQDDLLMGFKKDDEIVVSLTSKPKAGSLVVLHMNNKFSVARYENIDNNQYLWPPVTIETQKYKEIIFGQAVELIREL